MLYSAAALLDAYLCIVPLVVESATKLSRTNASLTKIREDLLTSPLADASLRVDQRTRLLVPSASSGRFHDVAIRSMNNSSLVKRCSSLVGCLDRFSSTLDFTVHRRILRVGQIDSGDRSARLSPTTAQSTGIEYHCRSHPLRDDVHSIQCLLGRLNRSAVRVSFEVENRKHRGDFSSCRKITKN